MDVLFVDNHLLVVNKPAGVLVQADRTGDLDLLTMGKAYLKERFDKPGNVFLGLVHRLDRPASGVMVFARTSKAAARLSEQFRQRTVEKRYFAIVEGVLEGAGIERGRVIKDAESVRMAPSDETHEGKTAELQWRAIASEDDLTLVDVQLKTGRKHQIRLQLAALDHAILGDFRYGARRELDGKNLALHCYRLGFHHPTQKERMNFAAGPSWGGRFDAAIRRLVESDD